MSTYLPRQRFGQAIDNNLVENAMPYRAWKEELAVLGNADAGERSVILYTIIESCRCRGIDPYATCATCSPRFPQ